MTRVFKKYDRLNASVHENVKGIRVVKTYVREEYENAKFARAADDVCNDFVRGEKIIAWNTPAVNLFMYACYILISVLGAYVIAGRLPWGSLTTGELSSLISYGINILSALMMLSMIIVIISMSAASAQRIAEVLREESAIITPEKPITEVEDGSIDFENVYFGYSGEGNYILENIGLQIRSGETLGIIGGTGSGKTSLVNLISRLYDAAAGCVKVGGIDVREYDPASLRRSVAVVLQKNVLFFRARSGRTCNGATRRLRSKRCKGPARSRRRTDISDLFPKGTTLISKKAASIFRADRNSVCALRALCCGNRKF